MTNKLHKVTLFGCGGWGERIARKLAKRDDVDLVLVDENQQRVTQLANELDCAYSCDPYGYLMVSGTARSTIEGGDVIIATPPGTRLELVRAILNGYGRPPQRLRIEKPLAIEYDDAVQIVGMCEDAGTRLTVGFTLLHHWQYVGAFDYIDAQHRIVKRVTGLRIGNTARHKASPIVDLGSHVAGVAAYLGAPVSIEAHYITGVVSRTTRLHLDNDDCITIDEINGTTQLPDGAVYDFAYVEPLDADLEAWLADAHRGDQHVALEAVRIIDNALEQATVQA